MALRFSSARLARSSARLALFVQRLLAAAQFHESYIIADNPNQPEGRDFEISHPQISACAVQ